MWRMDGDIVCFEHDIARPQRFRRRRIPVELRNQHTVFQADLPPLLAVDLLQNHPQPRAFHPAVADQFLRHLFCNVRGDGETQPDVAAGRRQDEVVYPDHLPLNVQERTAGVARVDRSVRLDIALVEVHSDATALLVRNNPDGDGPAEAEGSADGDRPVTDLHLFRVGETKHRKFLFGIDLQQREISRRIDAHHLRRELPSIMRRDPEGILVTHHMKIGQNITVFPDEKSGSLPRRHIEIVNLPATIVEEVGVRTDDTDPLLRGDQHHRGHRIVDRRGELPLQPGGASRRHHHRFRNQSGAGKCAPLSHVRRRCALRTRSDEAEKKHQGNHRTRQCGDGEKENHLDIVHWQTPRSSDGKFEFNIR